MKNSCIRLTLLALCFFLPYSAEAIPRVSNLNDIGTATVSWSTDFASSATVYYRRQGTSSFASASDSENAFAHYVKITGLNYDTDYEYYVQAGSLTDNNGGANYTFKTLPSGAPTIPGNQLNIGEVKSAGGSVSGKAIVYLKAYQEYSLESCLVSARVNKGSGWSYTLGNILTIDGGPYLWQEGDDILVIEVDGVDEGLPSTEYEFVSGLTDIPVVQLEQLVFDVDIGLRIYDGTSYVPAGPRVSNLNEIGTATVSWSTDFACMARVYYRRQGTATFTYATDSENAYTHYVKITGLSEATDYQYYLGFGSLIDNNGGSYYVFTTLPSGAPTIPGNQLNIGQIISAGGSVAGKAIVYLSSYQGGYQESCLVSARVDKGSGWSYTLGNMLTIDGGPYLWQEGDDTLVIAVDGVDENFPSTEYDFVSGVTDIPLIRLETMIYGTIPIACEPAGTLTSPLRIRKGATTYGIILVDPSDPRASRVRIKTPAGIRALKKL